MKPEDHWETEDALMRVAYGDAGLMERLRVRRLVQRDPAARQLFEEHLRVAQGTRALRHQMHSPERVLLRCQELRQATMGERRNYFPWAVAGGFAAMAVMTVAGVFGVMNRRQIQEPETLLVEYNELGMTPEEMARAKVEAETCLALFATALNGAGSLSHEIAEDAVAPRISQGLEQAQGYIF